MKSTRAILSVRYSPAVGGLGKSVGGFLRYIQHRDHVQRGEEGKGVAGLVRYVAYRDQASPEGRLFSRQGTAGTKERKELVRHVRRSLPDARPDSRKTPTRAVYRFVLSPEDARGLDLRQLARTTMGRLEQEAGPLPPWIAAEHRNTAHPHVHIVMAARREVAPGQFRGVMVTRQRLQAMKDATRGEIERQRGERSHSRPLERRLQELLTPTRRRRRPTVRLSPARQLDRALRRAAARYRYEAELEAERQVWSIGREQQRERGDR